MQQLSHQLAKVKRLISEEDTLAARAAVDNTLSTYFNVTVAELLIDPTALFLARFNESQKQPEALSLLADFLEEAAYLSEVPTEKKALYTHILHLYEALEQQHHVVSFAHLSKRKWLLQEIAGTDPESDQDFS